MGISPIWKRLEQSQLASGEQVQEFKDEYQRQQPPTQAITDPHICEWLIEQRAITRYQADVFLAGHHGPFDYGEYRVDDRVTEPPRKGAFRAVHQPTRCRVLLRFHDPRHGHLPWPEVLTRVASVQSLTHRSLTRVFEAVDLEQFRFVVVNDFRGETLASLIRRKEKLSPKRSCRLMLQIASAVGALQGQKVVHGALRPDNILVNEKGEVSIWFDPMQRPHNLAELSQADEATQVHCARYLAPELVDRSRSPDGLTDVYALGCLFYEMLAGRPPFDGGSLIDIMTHHASTPMAPLTSLGIPQPLEKVVAFMMAKKAELRYQQADVITEQVTRILKAGKALTDYDPTAVPAKDSELLSWLRDHGRQTGPSAGASAAAVPAASEPVPQTEPTAVAPEVIANQPGFEPAVPKIEVRDDRLELAKRRGVKRKSSGGPKPPMFVAIGAGFALLALLAVGGAWALWGGGGADEGDSVSQVPAEVDELDSPSDPDEDTNAGPPPAFQQTIVQDDRQQLWETPTVGPPLELDHVPGGLRVVIALRPADLLDQEEGVRLVRSLGESFGNELGDLENRLGVQLDQVEALVIGLHDNGGTRPRPSYRVLLSEGQSLDDLKSRWQANLDSANSTSELRVYRGQADFDFLTWPPSDDETVHSFLVADRADIDAVVSVDGAPPLMRQELEQLLRVSDVRRHVTVAAIPSALFNDEGRQLFSGTLQALLDPLEMLTGDGVAAALASFHLDNGLYLEAMLNGTLDAEPYQLKEQFSRQITELEDAYSTFVFTMGSNPYWDRVRMRFANWISLIQANTRIGVENRMVVTNCWLPLPAAHNLAAASELSLASTAGGFAHSSSSDDSDKRDVPQTIDELLDRKFKLNVPRNDLVLIVEELKQTVAGKYPELSFPFDIKMMGNDLQLEGITQNQSVNNFELDDQPLHAILTALMERAFKAPGVTGPSDPNFMLVWVVGPNPDQPDERIILVTTRVAAEKNDYSLPAAFQPKNP